MRRFFAVSAAAFAACFFLFARLIYAAGAPQDPQAAADSIRGLVEGKYGSPSAFQQNLSAPITSGGVPMTTLDGSQSFDAQLACPSSSKFIEVSISPLQTGDLRVTVSQDIDFDGVVDYTYAPPSDVSGVCANGVVSCDPGTWQNCVYYRWTADAISYVVSLQSVSMTELGGCYCVNQGCGANYSDYSPVLQDLGGGAVGAVQAVDSRFSISKASVAGYSIAYHGQDTSCATGDLTSSTLQVYYFNQDDAGLANAVNAEVAIQSQDSTSAYYLADQTFNNTSPGVYVASCDITRSVAVSINSYNVTGSSPAPASMCVDHNLYARVREVVNLDGTADYFLEVLDTDPNDVAHYGCDGLNPSDWHLLETVSLPRQASSVYFCVNASGAGCTPTGANCVSMANARVLVLVCGDTGPQSPSYTYTYDLQYREDALGEAINDGCSVLSSDPNCQLRAETVDGVATIANFASTGETAPQTCRTFTGVDTHELCRDYWTKTREYFCQGSGSPYDFSDVTARTDSVTGSLIQSGPVAAYTDYRADANGAFYFSNETLTTPDAGPYSSCIEVCKVRMPVTDTDAGLGGVTTDYRTDAQSYDVFYKQCSAGACPIDVAAGEELLSDCACADAFAEAAAIMTALEEASQDIICSSTGGW